MTNDLPGRAAPGMLKTRNRWALAAALDARLPQVRGRDRLLHLVRGGTTPRRLKRDILVRWGPGLEATVDPSLDGSLAALYCAQWVRPALVPILEACLRSGDTFVDVGANVGVYTTWAARIVGPAGAVLAMEPVPRTRSWLGGICAQNGLGQVEVISAAAGERFGSATIVTTDGASGRSRLTEESGEGLEVPITTLDSLLGLRAPALIKIDVEGGELAVLRGARNILQATHAPVVFEAPDFGGGRGTVDCVRLLESVGYAVFSLTTRGIRAFDPSTCSHNLLALDRSDRAIEHRLRDARFPRSQNT